jgi:thiol-disulfide isomerase/thioredoxin
MLQIPSQISRRQSLLGVLALGVGAVAGKLPAQASGLGRADVWKTLPLVRHDGTRFTLADLPSRAVLAVAWQSTCPSCLAELPQLQRLAQTMRQGEVDVVLISHPGAWATDYPVAVRNGLGAQAASIDPSVPRSLLVAALGLQDRVFDLPQSFAFARPDMRVVHSALGPVDWDDGDVVRRLRVA